MPNRHVNVGLNTDVAIVGGGMVGMALALKLAKLNISSVLLEAQDCDKAENENEHFDDRTLVINPASKLFWEQLDLWSLIEPHTTTINHVHVSNQGQFGVVNFTHEEFDVNQLGHVVAAKTLANILLAQVKKQTLITWLQPAQLIEFKADHKQINLTVKHTTNHSDHVLEASSQVITAQLMVGADGVQSGIRSTLNLATEVKSYQRTAIVCNVKTSQPHHHKAFERLTHSGPMALLPFKNRFGFVWSLLPELADQLLKTDEKDFIKQAQQHFGFRAGEFLKIGRRSSYPIYQIKVPVQHALRVVLMGNAAHSVSPVSAQGLNLAVRGIGRLSEQLASAKEKQLDLGDDAVLQAYQQASGDDQYRTMSYTDDLMTWFKIDEPVVNAIRSAGLVAVNASQTLKRKLFNTAGGMR